MEKTIYNVYVVMESQEQSDRMKQLCIDNGLLIWDIELGFELLMDEVNFNFHIDSEEFFVSSNIEDKTQETETEFIELLKTTK